MPQTDTTHVEFAHAELTNTSASGLKMSYNKIEVEDTSLLKKYSREQ